MTLFMFFFSLAFLRRRLLPLQHHFLFLLAFGPGCSFGSPFLPARGASGVTSVTPATWLRARRVPTSVVHGVTSVHLRPCFGRSCAHFGDARCDSGPPPTRLRASRVPTSVVHGVTSVHQRPCFGRLRAHFGGARCGFGPPVSPAHGSPCGAVLASASTVVRVCGVAAQPRAGAPRKLAIMGDGMLAKFLVEPSPWHPFAFGARLRGLPA